MTGTISGKSTYNASSSVVTAFAYTATGATLIGDYTESATGSHSASTNGANSFGQVIGYESHNSIYSTSSSGGSGVLGEEAWLYTPGSGSQFLGLFGANDTYTATTNSSYGTTDTYSIQVPQFITTTGYVAGTTNRYEGDSSTTPTASLGKSAWVEAPASANSAMLIPYEVGLTGSGNFATYNYSGTVSGTISSPYYSNSTSVISSGGEAAGVSSVFSGTLLNATTTLGSGTDAWVEQAGALSATRIGGFTFTSSSVTGFYSTTINANNSGVAYSQAIPSPTVTPASGPAFTATFANGYIPTTGSLGSTYATQVARGNTVTAINASGQVGLTSTYYIGNSASVTGTDAYIYTPSTQKYQQVGLTTSSWNSSSATPGVDSFVNTSGQRSSTIKFINTAGQSAGTSGVFIPGYTSSAFGQAAWYASASGATTQIGLYNTADGYHVNTFSGSGSQYSQYEYSESVTNMNDLGMVAGYASRYNNLTGSSNGQDAWVYDPNVGPNGKTFIVDPTAEAVNPATLESTQVYYLSPLGVALGELTYGASYPYSENAFIWSESAGFSLLDGNVSNLSSYGSIGYQNLINAYYSDSPGSTILASASFGTNSSTFAGDVTLVGTIPVPEPTTLSLLGVASLALVRRRRRVAN